MILKLHELLVENAEKIKFLKAKTDKIIVFGAGNTTSLYEKCFVAENIKVAGVIDNNSAKIGCSVLRKNVTLAKDALNDYGKNALVLISTPIAKTYEAIAAQLKQQGLLYCSVDEYVFANRVAEMIECFQLFEDDESRKLYTNVIAWHLSHKRQDIPFPYREQYFAYPEFLEPNANEVFVDMGAYVGDTIERYLSMHQGVFGKIYAFEPDPQNYQAMKYRVERLLKEWALTEDQIQLVPYGVGKDNIEMVIENGVQGLGSKLMGDESENGDKVHVVTLDKFFENQRVDFLKADIESFEFDMLCGAESVLQRDIPKLAICIYHNATDLYRTMIFLNKLNLGYRLRLCHHSVTQADTVLYAY